MNGLTVVVTGGSSGIGLAAAQLLARQGAHLVIVGRDRQRLSAAVDLVRQAAGGHAPDQFQADFARLDDVRALADHVLAAYPTIDVLANNAGAMSPEYTVTPDGFEAIMQSNHLAPFLLTNLLRERLRGGRVITTASVAHRAGRLDPDDLVSNAATYGQLKNYAATKTANILFAAEAARRWPDVLSASFHPGLIRTNFFTGAVAPVYELVLRLLPGTSVQAGADTLVWLARAPVEALVSGGYYVKRKLRQPGPTATDPALAERLWNASAKAVGL